MYTPTKSLQEAFDLMLSTMRAQNWVRSVRNFDDGVACAYRGDGGLKCAAGALISDACAAVADEGDDFGSWSIQNEEMIPFLEEQGWPTTEEAIQMYRSFQRIHDEECAYLDGGFIDYAGVCESEIRVLKERRCAELARAYELDYVSL